MRLFALYRLDLYARARVVEGSKAWELYRTIADEKDAQLVGTMLVKLEAEHGNAGAVAFLNQSGHSVFVGRSKPEAV